MGRENQNRAQSLAPNLHAISHGFMQTRWGKVGVWQELIEALVDQILPFIELLVEIHDLRTIGTMSYSRTYAKFGSRMRKAFRSLGLDAQGVVGRVLVLHPFPQPFFTGLSA